MNRRKALRNFTGGIAALTGALTGARAAEERLARPTAEPHRVGDVMALPCHCGKRGPRDGYFPDVIVTSHEAERARFYSDLPTWTQRAGSIKVTLKNGDHFVHGYINVDFGGSRGWENQFQSTVKVDGTGCDFTFGRAHWWLTAGGDWGLIDVPPVDANGAPGVQKLEFVLNFDPSSRIKFYQFDPYHHDVAVYSLH